MCSLVDKLPLEPFVEMAERTDTVTRSREKNSYSFAAKYTFLGLDSLDKMCFKKTNLRLFGPKNNNCNVLRHLGRNRRETVFCCVSEKASQTARRQEETQLWMDTMCPTHSKT